MTRAGGGGYFDDALLGADGTQDPVARHGYRDALAQDAAPAQEWGGFALPRLPVAPGGGEQAARALVEADELPRVPRVPAGPWGELQPAPEEPASWSAAGGGTTAAWAGTLPDRPLPFRRPSPSRRPAPRPPAPLELPTRTLRSSGGVPTAVLAAVLLVLLVGLVLLS